MKSRKGDLYFDLPLMIILPLILGYALLTIHDITGTSTENFGREQQAIIDTSVFTQQAMLQYLDFAGKFIGEQAIYDMGQHGGYFSEPSCGQYLGYARWNYENEACYPSKTVLAEQFRPFAQTYLSSYLSVYPELATAIQSDDYLFSLTGEQYYALPLRRISLPLKTVELKTYEETPSEITPPLSVYTPPASAVDALAQIRSQYASLIQTATASLSPKPDESLIAAVIMQESRGDPNAVSPTGCRGIMQFCSATAYDYGLCDCVGTGCGKDSGSRQYCVNKDLRFDFNAAIPAGATYLSNLLGSFESYADKESFAIAAYNGGEGLVKKAISRTGKSSPAWQEAAAQIDEALIEEAYCTKVCSRYFDEPGERAEKAREIVNYVAQVKGYKEAYISLEGFPITVAAVVSREPEKVEKTFGILTFNPAFKADLPFNIANDFSYLAERAKQLKQICEKEKDVAACAQSMAAYFDSSLFSRTEQCGNPIRSVQEQFIEQLALCYRSADTACGCRIVIPAGPYSALRIENGETTRIIVEDEEGKTYERSSEGSFLPPDATYYSFSPGDETYWLKENGVLRLDSETVNKPSCAIQQDTFRFCIQRSSGVDAYDAMDQKNALRNVYYRFALHIPSKAVN